MTPGCHPGAGDRSVVLAPASPGRQRAASNGAAPGVTARYRLCRGTQGLTGLSRAHRAVPTAQVDPRGRGHAEGDGAGWGWGQPRAGISPRLGNIAQVPVAKGDSPLRTDSASASLPMDCASRICQGRRGFSSLYPPPARSGAPPHSSYLDLILQVLSSGHQGLDLVGTESGHSPSGARPPGTAGCHRAGTHLGMEQLPPPPRRLRCRGNLPRDEGWEQDPSLPQNHGLSPNSPARSSSSSPKLCWYSSRASLSSLPSSSCKRPRGAGCAWRGPAAPSPPGLQLPLPSRGEGIPKATPHLGDGS